MRNLDKYKSIINHWIPFYVNGDNVAYFDYVRVGYIPKKKVINRQPKYQKKYLENTRKLFSTVQILFHWIY